MQQKQKARALYSIRTKIPMPVCLPTRYLTSDVSGNLSFNASPAEWRLEHLHHRDGVRVPIYHTDDAQQISNSIHRGNLISVLLI